MHGLMRQRHGSEVVINVACVFFCKRERDLADTHLITDGIGILMCYACIMQCCGVTI